MAKQKPKKKTKPLTDEENRLDSVSIGMLPERIADKLTAVQRRFLVAHIVDNLPLTDAWTLTHPTSRTSQRVRWVKASEMWKTIREKFKDNPRDFFEAMGLGMGTIREVLARNLNATRPVVRNVTDAEGNTQTRMVNAQDGHVQLRALKELTILMGVRTEKIEHSGAVGVSMSDIHAANEDTEEN